LANIAKDGNCATRGACAKGGVIAKDVKLRQGLQLHQGGWTCGGQLLAGNSNFADEIDFAERSNTAAEVCDSTNKNISGLNKRQCYKRSDATAMMAMRHHDKVKMPVQCWLQCEVPKVTMPAQPVMTPAQ
jgi:hypothetical protein